MSSNNSTPSFEEMETMVQDELINLIKEKVNHPQVRFWEPSERISDDEILATYPVVYNIFIDITHTSKKNKQNVIEIQIGKNFQTKLFGVNLPHEVTASFRAFGRTAAKILYTYFLERNSLYVGKIRLDVIPVDDNGNFVIPNLVLSDNIFLYKSILDANSSHARYNEHDTKRIDYGEYVKSRIEDLIAEKEFAEMLKKNQNHKESS